MKTQNENQLSRVITFLTREELDFIDKISKDSLYTTGKKLSRSKIMEAMVCACMKTRITGENVRSKKELEDRLFNAISRMALERVQAR